jgi:hypothetical protein
MEEHKTPSLPKVEQDDILLLDPMDIISAIDDPQHVARFTEMLDDNPQLARELLRRVYEATRNNPERQTEILAFISYEYSLLQAALKRTVKKPIVPEIGDTPSVVA